MLDGGIADSLPIMRARDFGYDNNVVVLTRNKGYRKSNKPSFVPPFVYHKYPALREALRNRNLEYNKQISLIEELEERGEVTIICPERPIEVGRMERDIKRLTALYDEGYEIASRIEFCTE
jgi:predicted patatin/cPLA2 family phospholipase